MDNISARIQFRSIDTNGDGSLDLVELSNGLSDFGLTDAEIEAIFVDLDVNNDGRVSEEEYVAGLLGNYCVTAAAVFTKLLSYWCCCHTAVMLLLSYSCCCRTATLTPLLSY